MPDQNNPINPSNPAPGGTPTPSFSPFPTDSSIPPSAPPGPTGTAAPPLDIPAVVTPPSGGKKGVSGKVVATILGLLLLVGGIGAGILLVGQQQIFKQKAAGVTCAGGATPGQYKCSNSTTCVQCQSNGLYSGAVDRSNCSGQPCGVSAPPPPLPSYGSCTSPDGRKGTCMNTSSCDTSGTPPKNDATSGCAQAPKSPPQVCCVPHSAPPSACRNVGDTCSPSIGTCCPNSTCVATGTPEIPGICKSTTKCGGQGELCCKSGTPCNGTLKCNLLGICAEAGNPPPPTGPNPALSCTVPDGRSGTCNRNSECDQTKNDWIQVNKCNISSGAKCCVPKSAAPPSGANCPNDSTKKIAKYIKFTCPNGCVQTTESGVTAYRCYDNRQDSTTPLSLSGACGQVDAISGSGDSSFCGYTEYSCGESRCQAAGGGGGPSAPTGPTAQCLNIQAFDTNWTQLSGSQLAALKPGDKVRFTVAGQTSSGSFDMARFIINGVTRSEVTGKRPTTEEFFDEYTIPDGISTFSINAQLHHSTLGWF